MSLTAAFHIGRSALAASQIGVQVTGNNIANVGTPGYSRQIVGLTPERGDYGQVGLGLGRGVRVQDVRRQVDQALLDRLWHSGGGEAAARQQLSILNQLEATLGELGDSDLSSEFASFFRAWSERSNQTQASGVVVQQGDRLAGFMRRVRADLMDQRGQLDGQLGATVSNANGMLDAIAELNRAIGDAEVNGGAANSLRDRRDQFITQLSELMDVSVIDRGPQGVDVLVGSTPVVLGGQSRGLDVRREAIDGEVVASVVTRVDGQRLDIGGGTLGALLQGRDEAIDQTIATLDRLAAQLVHEVNRLHSTGENLAGLSRATGFVALPVSERSLALNDPNNLTLAGLPVAPTNGGFLLKVKDVATGATRTVRIGVDLDGMTNAGTPGFTDDTSAESIRAQVDAIDGISAGFTPDGKLDVRADSGFSFSFADDSSGVLAVLGLNAYFTGTDAASIGVRDDLKADTSLLTAGRTVGGVFVENGTALEIANLQGKGLAALGGRSITAAWSDTAQGVGVKVAAARTNAEAAGVVRASLEAQRDAVSGVSLDEEAINLLNFQRQYQAAARIVSVADELTQTLINLV